MHHSIKKKMLMKVVKNKYEQLHNVHLIILNEWIYFDLFPKQDTAKQRERRTDEAEAKEKQETSERINQRDASEKKEEQQENER
jgi:hypothetical protein